MFNADCPWCGRHEVKRERQTRIDRIRSRLHASLDRGQSTVLLGVVDLSTLVFAISAAEEVIKNPSQEWALTFLKDSLEQLKEIVP